MNQNGSNDVIDIDLGQIVQTLIKKLWLIIIAFILGGVIAFMYTQSFVTPLYQSTVKLYVNDSGISVGNISISATELSSSAGLVSTYVVILETRNTLEEVIEVADLSYSYEQLLSMIDASSVDDTAIFQITVTSANPAEAQYIANTIAEVLPDKIVEILSSGSVSIVDLAVVASSPSSSALSSNTIKGALAGAMIAAVIIVILYLLNQEIKSESELASMYDIPVLAAIPNYNLKGSGYYTEYGKSAKNRSDSSSKEGL